MYLCVVMCSTIGQLSYLGEISVLGHFNETTTRLHIFKFHLSSYILGNFHRHFLLASANYARSVYREKGHL